MGSKVDSSRRWQRLATDEPHQRVDADVDATVKVAILETGRDDLADHSLGGGVVDRAFETVTDLDAQLAVLFGNQQQRAVIHPASAEFPRLGDAQGVLFDALRSHCRHDQHGDLRTFLAFEVGQFGFESAPLFG